MAEFGTNALQILLGATPSDPSAGLRALAGSLRQKGQFSQSQGQQQGKFDANLSENARQFDANLLLQQDRLDFDRERTLGDVDTNNRNQLTNLAGQAAFTLLQLKGNKEAQDNVLIRQIAEFNQKGLPMLAASAEQLLALPLDQRNAELMGDVLGAADALGVPAAFFSSGSSDRRVKSSTDLGGGAVQVIYTDGTTEIKTPDEAQQILIDDARKSQLEFEQQKAKVKKFGAGLGEAEAIPIIEEAQATAFVDAEEVKRPAIALTVAEKEQALQDVKGTAKRFDLLRDTKAGRLNNLNKAIEFRDLIQSGARKTGAGRRALKYVPTFTDQGEFDEVFDAFAEVAARQLLKASGETRPTDADVKGMKAAMFGVGRSEGANIKLLNEFIALQESDIREFEGLNKKFKGRVAAREESSNDEADLDAQIKALEAEIKGL